MLHRLTAAICAIGVCLSVKANAAPESHAPREPRRESTTVRGGAPPPPLVRSDDTVRVKVDEAIAAWRSGRWTDARAILEPMAASPALDSLSDLRETVLRYLADSTLFDGSLEINRRRTLARRHIEALFAEVKDWDPPRDAHGSEFYLLVDEVRASLAAERASSCRAERLSCSADLMELRVDHRGLQHRHSQLQADHDEQMVPIVHEVARNRGVAMLPLGIGHFYNDKFRLGALFLGSEALFGGIALALLIDRNVHLNCTREGRSFAHGAMTCSPPPSISDSQVVVRRNMEQVFGYVFLGTLILDVLTAQITFKKTRVISTREVPRRDLEDHLRTGDRRSPKRPRSTSSRVEMQWRASPTLLRSGGGAEVHLRF